MKYLDLTLQSPAENLACDEALLDSCDESESLEVLRLWEPQQHFVVVGYANQVSREVNVEACRNSHVPILRRCTGGGTVLQGPGCLNYSLLLKITGEGPLRNITVTNRFVMEQNRQALEKLSGQPVRVAGHTDLAVNDKKFSGNAQRRKRRALLFHGTFLLQFELPLIGKLLLPPSRQPAYRQDRDHHQFLTNFPAVREAVTGALQQAWNAKDILDSTPVGRIETLVRDKYGRQDWNCKF